MDNIELNNKLELTTDEDLLIIKFSVDEYLVKFNMGYDIDARNELINIIHKLIIKKYLASSNSIYNLNKKYIIDIIVKSYMINLKNKQSN